MPVLLGVYLSRAIQIIRRLLTDPVGGKVTTRVPKVDVLNLN